MKLIIYTAAIAAAFITVLSTRLLIPALIICFKAIEESFAPDDVDSTSVLTAPLPVVVADAEPKRKPRKARRRRPSAQTLAAIEALA